MLTRSGFANDFALLQPLLVLLEQRGVSRAAERLGISQPSMSRILARLRDQFQDPLLVRGPHGMVLTPRAEALQAPLLKWVSDGDDLLRAPAFDPLHSRATFKVASSDFGVLSVVNPVLETLQTGAPDCTLAVEPLSDSSLRRLSEGVLDVVITGYRPEGSGLQSRVLFVDHYLGVARKGHPIFGTPLSTDDVLDWPHVVTTVGPGLGDWIAKALPDITFRKGTLHSNSFSLTPHMVAASNAMAILPARAAIWASETLDLKTFVLPFEFAPLDYYLVWHERSGADPATLWLIDLLSPQDAASR